MRRNVLHHNSPFEFETGGRLDSMDIVYHTSDRDRVPADKVVWVCHALTGNSDPSDWWAGMVGPGKLFDPGKVFVVCVSMLCSAYGECGPASPDPATGRPRLLDFPETTVRDMVRAGNLVREHLGIEHIDVMLGPSIGGFQTVEWLVSYPEVVRKAVILATAARATPYLTAFNESQRLAMLADPSFLAAESVRGGEAGLVCARSIALISYRTYMGYNATQAEKDEDCVIADRAASYQRYQGRKLVARDFDAYSYWYLTRALDSMNVGRGRGGVAAALATVRAECSVISITSDQLFPPCDLRDIARMVPRAEYHEIDSIFGHDGFLIENDVLVEILKPFIEKQ